MITLFRIFSAAETDKEGDPLNKIRREARSSRRRIRRRAHRLLRLRRLFKRCAISDDTNPQSFMGTASPWQLRAEGLDRRLSRQEWAAALYHIVKHRGFQSNRKAELKHDVSAGLMLSGVKSNKKIPYISVGYTAGIVAFRGERGNYNEASLIWNDMISLN